MSAGKEERAVQVEEWLRQKQRGIKSIGYIERNTNLAGNA